VLPGGSIMSKPAWPNACGYLGTPFFLPSANDIRAKELDAMDKIPSTMARQIGEAATEFEQQRTGHLPESVTVVLGGSHERQEPSKR
jgi:hypothetical protein